MASTPTQLIAIAILSVLGTWHTPHRHIVEIHSLVLVHKAYLNDVGICVYGLAPLLLHAHIRTPYYTTLIPGLPLWLRMTIA